MKKTCTICNETKPYEEFHKLKASPDGYAPRCKVCHKKRMKDYYAQNSSRLKENRKEYRDTYPEKEKESKRASYYKHRERNLERSRQYYKDNKQKFKDYDLKRRKSLDLVADNTITKEALEELMSVQNSECYHCGTDLTKLDSRNVHLDHYIPLSKGGIHSIGNVVWSCVNCNKSKFTTIPDQPLIFKI